MGVVYAAYDLEDAVGKVEDAVGKVEDAVGREPKPGGGPIQGYLYSPQLSG